MPAKILHIKPIGNVTFLQNSRSRNIRLSVKPNKRIVVTYPLYVTFKEAVRFTEQHTEWVTRQQQKFQTHTFRFSENTVIQTRFHSITFRRHHGSFSLKQIKEQIEILIPEQKQLDDPDLCKQILKILTEIYRWEAKKFLPPRLLELAVKHGFTFKKITIRNNTTNWGSCSGQNNISLNLHLMKLPDHLVDYILLHELVHTKIKNHGPKFKEMLDSVTGNQAGKLRTEIRKYSPYTI
jgi:predicted metal-dependent hydrolase